MDNRFTDIICEMEGIISPEDARLLAIEELIRSQLLEEKIITTVEEVTSNLYSIIYEEEDEE